MLSLNNHKGILSSAHDLVGIDIMILYTSSTVTFLKVDKEIPLQDRFSQYSALVLIGEVRHTLAMSSSFLIYQ